jgi:hypothetical protein
MQHSLRVSENKVLTTKYNKDLGKKKKQEDGENRIRLNNKYY